MWKIQKKIHVRPQIAHICLFTLVQFQEKYLYFIILDWVEKFWGNPN
jgi:hypothetical protein